MSDSEIPKEAREAAERVLNSTAFESNPALVDDLRAGIIAEISNLCTRWQEFLAAQQRVTRERESARAEEATKRHKAEAALAKHSLERRAVVEELKSDLADKGWEIEHKEAALKPL